MAKNRAQGRVAASASKTASKQKRSQLMTSGLAVAALVLSNDFLFSFFCNRHLFFFSLPHRQAVAETRPRHVYRRQRLQPIKTSPLVKYKYLPLTNSHFRGKTQTHKFSDARELCNRKSVPGQKLGREREVLRANGSRSAVGRDDSRRIAVLGEPWA